ncbi:DUF1877 family protein [Micromonospora zhanjiangensis]|uniref:DUF1877 family protein n=1 Tax=Micromonospora zhanjiangensis TaxID=1522057 RepID=A0ABV8KLW8_9ACTN
MSYPGARIRSPVYPRFWDGDGDLDYLEPYYQSLVAFFVETAGEGAAAIRSFDF